MVNPIYKTLFKVLTCSRRDGTNKQFTVSQNSKNTRNSSELFSKPKKNIYERAFFLKKWQLLLWLI